MAQATSQAIPTESTTAVSVINLEAVQVLGFKVWNIDCSAVLYGDKVRVMFAKDADRITVHLSADEALNAIQTLGFDVAVTK